MGKKLFLTYVPPPKAPVPVAKEKKKKKKEKRDKKKIVEVKTRGTITEPPPITVNSATWVPPTRTKSQGVTTTLRSTDVGVQGEMVRRREFSPMTEERRR